MSFSRIVIELLLNLQQVRSGVDHSAVLRRVCDFDRLVRLAQAEPAYRRRDVLQLAREALHQRDLDLFVCHECVIQRPYARISSSVLPRLAAMVSGEFTLASAMTVARTTLIGLREPY